MATAIAYAALALAGATIVGGLAGWALELRAIRRLRQLQERERYGAAMPGPHRRTSTNHRTPTYADRQLTLGECLALVRYAEHLLDGTTPGLAEALRTIDDLEVCTTCGWSRSVHEAAGVPVHDAGVCAQWTGRPVH